MDLDRGDPRDNIGEFVRHALVFWNWKCWTVKKVNEDLGFLDLRIWHISVAIFMSYIHPLSEDGPTLPKRIGENGGTSRKKTTLLLLVSCAIWRILVGVLKTYIYIYQNTT